MAVILFASAWMTHKVKLAACIIVCSIYPNILHRSSQQSSLRNNNKPLWGWNGSLVNLFAHTILTYEQGTCNSTNQMLCQIRNNLNRPSTITGYSSCGIANPIIEPMRGAHYMPKTFDKQCKVYRSLNARFKRPSMHSQARPSGHLYEDRPSVVLWTHTNFRACRQVTK